MSTDRTPDSLREQKKRATRQQLSNTATRLFIEHGFDHVTIADIAAAANVSKMTVFNYFPRKEALFFDRIDEIHQLLQGTLDRHRGRSPVAALRALSYELVEQAHPLTRTNDAAVEFWATVAASPSLYSYAIEQFEAVKSKLSDLLCVHVGVTHPDPAASLIATIILNTWRIAFGEALRLHATVDSDVSQRIVLDLLDRGFSAAEAAANGTPYA